MLSDNRNFEPNGLIDFYYSENYERYLEYVSNKFNNEYVKMYFKDKRFNFRRNNGMSNEWFDDAVFLGTGTWDDVSYFEIGRKKL